MSESTTGDSPTKAAFFIEQGDTLWKLHRHEEALAAYQQASRLDPHAPSACAGMGRALWALNRYEEALVAYERASMLDPHTHAANSDALKRFTEWKDLLQRLEDQQEIYRPESPHVLFGMAYSLWQLKRDEEAVATYDLALEQDPTFASASLYKGLALITLGRYEEALAAYERSIELAPDDMETHSGKGLALRYLRRYEEALATYERAISVAYEHFEEEEFYVAGVYVGKGEVLSALGRHQEALEAYEQAGILPMYRLPWSNKADALRALGSYEEALAAYDQAIEQDPHDAHAYTGKGQTLQRLGHQQEAQQCYLQASTCDLPRDEPGARLILP